MSDADKPHLSRVAPVVQLDEGDASQIERALVSLLSRWARSAGSFALRKLGLLGVGIGAGVGATNAMDDAEDVPVSQQAPASGPSPAPSAGSDPHDVRDIETCAQAREDARLAVEVFGAYAEACGIDPDNLPKPEPPIREKP